MKLKTMSVLLCALLLVAVCGCSKNKEPYQPSQTDNTEYQNKPQVDSTTYRNVKVIEVAGTATLTREAQQQSVYKQMVVNGDDSITTEQNSTVDLLLDSDKYARIYENSEILFKLEGNPSKGAIRIYLNKGGIYSKIESKLSAEDCYEIHTPDAVMAVRGTAFEVIITSTGNARETTVSTESGSVEITLLNSNGDTKMNEAGDTVIIESETDDNGNRSDPEFKEETSTTPSKKPTTRTTKTSTTKKTETTTVLQTTTTTTTTQTTTTTVTQAAPVVNTCSNCGKELAKEETHLLTCAAEHYRCDGQDHSVCIDCNKRMCDISVHTPLVCGVHYPCTTNAFDGHDAMECGHYLCGTLTDTETVIHEQCVNCNTFACKTGKEHYWAECSCVYCEGPLGPEHVLCDTCYGCKSDGKEHGLCPYCYGCISDGQNHSDGVCNTTI